MNRPTPAGRLVLPGNRFAPRARVENIEEFLMSSMAMTENVFLFGQGAVATMKKVDTDEWSLGRSSLRGIALWPSELHGSWQFEFPAVDGAHYPRAAVVNQIGGPTAQVRCVDIAPASSASNMYIAAAACPLGSLASGGLTGPRCVSP
jgi:hypothetical protein